MKNFSFHNILFLFITLSAILFLSSCDDDHNHDEGELITTLQYTLIDTIHKDTVIFTFRDLDGEGGNEPELPVTGILKSYQLYLGEVRLLNESVNPPVDIGKEVAAEDLAHQFFYLVSGSLNLQVFYADKDAKNQRLGLKTTVLTGAASKGNLRIILRHNPNKNAPDVSLGNPANAGGETDIDVTFEDVPIL
jgi:hypothetical protein